MAAPAPLAFANLRTRGRTRLANAPPGAPYLEWSLTDQEREEFSPILPTLIGATGALGAGVDLHFTGNLSWKPALTATSEDSERDAPARDPTDWFRAHVLLCAISIVLRTTLVHAKWGRSITRQRVPFVPNRDRLTNDATDRAYILINITRTRDNALVVDAHHDWSTVQVGQPPVTRVTVSSRGATTLPSLGAEFFTGTTYIHTGEFGPPAGVQYPPLPRGAPFDVARATFAGCTCARGEDACSTELVVAKLFAALNAMHDIVTRARLIHYTPERIPGVWRAPVDHLMVGRICHGIRFDNRTAAIRPFNQEIYAACLFLERIAARPLGRRCEHPGRPEDASPCPEHLWYIHWVDAYIRRLAPAYWRPGNGRCEVRIYLLFGFHEMLVEFGDRLGRMDPDVRDSVRLPMARREDLPANWLGALRALEPGDHAPDFMDSVPIGFEPPWVRLERQSEAAHVVLDRHTDAGTRHSRRFFDREVGSAIAAAPVRRPLFDFVASAVRMYLGTRSYAPPSLIIATDGPPRIRVRSSQREEQRVAPRRRGPPGSLFWAFEILRTARLYNRDVCGDSVN